MTSYDDGAWRSGEIVLIRLWNANEDRGARGKVRPAVLVGRDDGHWKTMGLTTNPAYAGGAERVAVPNPQRVGLSGPGYLWGNRLASIGPLDIERHLGWVDVELAEAVILLADLDDRDAAALRSATSL